jgi:hypothetical protein
MGLTLFQLVILDQDVVERVLRDEQSREDIADLVHLAGAVREGDGTLLVKLPRPRIPSS